MAAAVKEVTRREKPVRPATRKAARPVTVPAYFAAALRKQPKALKAFAAFPPSHKREYVDWIASAKTEDTRERRIATALGWIAAGKSRNWKYQ